MAHQRHKWIFTQRMEKSKPKQRRRESHPWGSWPLQGKMGTDGSAPGLSLSCWQVPQGVRREGDAQLVPGKILMTPTAGNKKIIEANKVKAGGSMQGCEPGWGEPAYPPSFPAWSPTGGCPGQRGAQRGGGLTLSPSCPQVPASP